MSAQRCKPRATDLDVPRNLPLSADPSLKTAPETPESLSKQPLRQT